MESEHFIGKVALKAFIAHEGKVLLVRDARDSRNELWDLPGGRLHRGESFVEGLAREVMEEMGIEIMVDNVAYTGQFISGFSGEPHVMVIYRATLKEPEKEMRLDPAEIAEYRWIGPEDLPNIKVYDSYEPALYAYFNTER